MRRYAIYYAPRPEEPLASFARAWLGRDPETGEACDQLIVPGISAARLREVTAEPRHYGFHGTLKPPFALAGGSAAELLRAVEEFASTHPAFDVPALRLAVIGRFIALVPHPNCASLDTLAANCVRAFDLFRAPPLMTELARRRAAGLTARQDELLVRWGYPYVMEEFRFHLTLTSNLDEPERSMINHLLEDRTAAYRTAPLPVRDLVVFMQEDRNRPFSVIARSPLQA